MKNTTENQEHEANAMQRANTIIKKCVGHVNACFNKLPLKTKQATVITFGVATATLCFWLIFNTITNQSQEVVHIDKITTPTDSNSNSVLTPLGKFIGDQRDSIKHVYLAIDNAGQLYANQLHPVQSDVKPNGWKPVTQQQVEVWYQHLQFIPHKNIKHD